MISDGYADGCSLRELDLAVVKRDSLSAHITEQVKSRLAALLTLALDEDAVARGKKHFKILYEHGGVYFDTDVEVIKPFDDILEKGNFMGCENKVSAVNPGIGLAVAPKLEIVREILDDYEKDSFLNDDGSLDLTTIVTRTTDVLKRHGLQELNEIQTVAGINVYPVEYFCPIDMSSGRLIITENTHSIHRYAGTWETKGNKFRGKVYRFINRTFGENAAEKIRKIAGRKQ